MPEGDLSVAPGVLAAPEDGQPELLRGNSGHRDPGTSRLWASQRQPLGGWRSQEEPPGSWAHDRMQFWRERAYSQGEARACEGWQDSAQLRPARVPEGVWRGPPRESESWSLLRPLWPQEAVRDLGGAPRQVSSGVAGAAYRSCPVLASL